MYLQATEEISQAALDALAATKCSRCEDYKRRVVQSQQQLAQSTIEGDRLRAKLAKLRATVARLRSRKTPLRQQLAS